MSDGRITIQIPATPMSLNRYSKAHWATQRRDKQEWQLLIRSQLHKSELPTGLQRVQAYAIFRFPVKRRRDIGNFQATLEKYLGDALQPIWLDDDTHDRFTVTASISDEKGPALTTISLDFWLPAELEEAA